ncbi:NUDIX hydrolase [Halomonas binhaiensis]|uniref:NUDIX hydrolase n=1 Tax=Halomonas binhaiensis TaxID=2562282 RepID=A0A5C1NKT4_9GAMM|nr:NUDIX domain-containing protein [Halomonas binhaiensis]QEM83390.1 NUDIX hydrolase [Halomonas binhaiensis]
MSSWQSEAEFLEHYDSRHYSGPLVSVDVAIFTLHEAQLKVLLVQRGEFPCKGRWALPGGFINMGGDADLYATARRKLKDKTGVDAPLLEQVCSLGNDARDPRGWSVTVLYMALVPWAPTAEFMESVTDARWWPVQWVDELAMAFDHAALIEAARDRLKNKTAYTVLPVHVLKRPFTLTQLQNAFELLMDTQLEKKSFRRRILNAKILEEAGEASPEGGRGRPAALYVPARGSEKHLFARVFGETA